MCAAMAHAAQRQPAPFSGAAFLVLGASAAASLPCKHVRGRASRRTTVQHSAHSLRACQVLDTERCFVIHHANAYEEGDEVVVWSSGWGPEALQALAAGSGMLGSWKVVLQGDFDDIPLTSIWRHRCAGPIRSIPCGRDLHACQESFPAPGCLRGAETSWLLCPAATQQWAITTVALHCCAAPLLLRAATCRPPHMPSCLLIVPAWPCLLCRPAWPCMRQPCWR